MTTDVYYEPKIDGVPADPSIVGGSVDKLMLFSTADRDGVAAVDVGPAVRVAPGRYRFVVPSTALGRFWPRVLWTPSTGAAQRTDDLPSADLPIRADLAVSPESLADTLGIPLPITAAQRDELARVIIGAQADVEAYLGRPVVPEVFTERQLWPMGGGWRLANSPVVEVLAEAAEVDQDGRETGYWTVTYRAGLNVRDDRTYGPIQRVIVAHAAEQPAAVRMWREHGYGAGGGDRRVRSVGAEGQSVSYEYMTPSGQSTAAAGSVGGPVLWKTIDRWRIAGRRVFTRKDATFPSDTYVRIL